MVPRREDPPGVVYRERVRALLTGNVPDGEPIVAEGRTAQGPYLVVTPERLLLAPGTGGAVEAIRFQTVAKLYEVPSGHSTTLVLVHDPLPRRRPWPLPWDIPQWIRWWRTGDRWRTETVLRFNRADAKAAVAIRDALEPRLGRPEASSSWRPPPWP